MPTIDIDLGSVEVGTGRYADDTLDFAGADTYAPGTILARLAANLRLTPFVVGGSGGAGVPVAVLGYEVEATGASTVPARVIVGGTVNADRLIIHADGDNSNMTKAHLDQLRDYGIFAVPVKQLNR